MFIIRRSLRVAAVVLFTIAAALSGQAKTKSERPELAIVLRGSRPQVSAGSGFGLFADIENKSESEVFLSPRFLTMTPPPEIDPGSPTAWWATLRGVMPGDSNPSVQDAPEAIFNTIFRLGPGDKTTAFWARGPEGGFFQQLAGYVSLLSFSPSEYTIKVVAVYWPDERSAMAKANNYHSDTSEIKLNVVAPQGVIIFGSILGGLIAYALLPRARLRSRDQAVHWIWGILTSVLLSAIVTILLARISDTQFVVRVTVNDIWGAVAVGFVANASGVAILNKYTSAPRANAQTNAGA